MEFIKAMRWGSKVIIPLFLLHAVLYFIYAYQLKSLEVPSFEELEHVEGRLIFERKNRHSWIGVERDDGTREVFACSLPNFKNLTCVTPREAKLFGLDDEPRATIWWKTLDVPFESKRYRYPMQIKLAREKDPLKFVLENGFVRDYSYGGRKASIERVVHDYHWEFFMGLAYLCFLALIAFVEWIRFSRMRD
jgi:hypothetical protein